MSKATGYIVVDSNEDGLIEQPLCLALGHGLPDGGVLTYERNSVRGEPRATHRAVFPTRKAAREAIIYDAGVVALLLDNQWTPREAAWTGYERLPWRFKFLAGRWHGVAVFEIDPQPETRVVRVCVPFLFRWLRLPRWQRVTIKKHAVVVGYQRYCPDAQPPKFFEVPRHLLTGDRFALSVEISE